MVGRDGKILFWNDGGAPSGDLGNSLYCKLTNQETNSPQPLPRESAMAHLTLQEVIDRINNNRFSSKHRFVRGDGERRAHHPEFYVPRITRFFAGLLLGAAFPAGRMAGVRKQNDPHSVAL